MKTIITVILLLFIPSCGLCFGISSGVDITIINGQLFINGMYIPKTKFIDPDLVLRATILGKNKASKRASNVVNSINIVNSEITSTGNILPKRFSAMDVTGYRAVKRFKVLRSSSQGFGVTSRRSGGMKIDNKVNITNSRVDEYAENIGTAVRSRSLTGAKINNDVNVTNSRIGVR